MPVCLESLCNDRYTGVFLSRSAGPGLLEQIADALKMSVEVSKSFDEETAFTTFKIIANGQMRIALMSPYLLP
jgi:hypothetical protein